MFGFLNFAMLLFLLVSVCNGAPALKLDDLDRRNRTPLISRSDPLRESTPLHQKRTGGGGGAGMPGGGGSGAGTMSGGAGGGAPRPPPGAGGGK